MGRAKIAITLSEAVLDELDELVADGAFPNRSRGIEGALREKLERLKQTRLMRECGKLEREEERSLAEEGMAEELAEWPEY